MELEFHPLSEVFPLIDGPGRDKLVQSIKENGLREAITLYEGAILDGRNRYLACRAAGVELKTEEFSGGDPAAFVADKNGNRRHLTASQRAIAAAKMSILSIDRMDHRVGNGRFKKLDMTAEKAAMLLGVGIASVRRARHVLMNGSKADINGIESGESSVHATIARVAENRQKPDMRRYAGPKLKIPAGQVASRLCRDGLKMEDEGANAETAAESLNIGIGSYRQMRDIVLLCDRDDLGAADAKLAAAALKKLDETSQPGVAHQMVKGLVDRIWRTRLPRRGKAEKKAIDHFNGTILMIHDTCERLAELKVPQLSEEDVNESLKNLRDAERYLGAVRRKLQELRR